MDFFTDVDIPLRPAREKNTPPEGFCLWLRLDEGTGALRLEPQIPGEAEPVRYTGHGWFATTHGTFHCDGVQLLDPFIDRRSVISPRHFKILFRIILPKLLRENVPARWDLTMEKEPPVTLTPGEPNGGRLPYTVCWRIPPEQLRELPGLDDYTLCGHTLYPGKMRHLKRMPKSDGTAEGEKKNTLYRLYQEAPNLFTAPPPRPVKIPEVPRAGDFSQLQDFFQYAGPQMPEEPGRIRILPAPALVTAEILPDSRMEDIRGARFAREMERFQDVHGSEETQPVHFAGYYPVYSDMTPSQLEWYCTWRDAFRAGKAPQTDLAYIFMYCYELFLPEKDPKPGLEALLRVWKSYRETYPFLDRVMPGWCVDYVLVNDMEPDFDRIHEAIPFDLDLESTPQQLEIFCSRRLGEGLTHLPPEVLCALAGYRMQESRFYCAEDGDRPLKHSRELCREAVLLALDAADNRMRRENGAGLLEHFAPPRKTVLWSCYRSAVRVPEAALRIRLTYVPYSSCRELREFLNALLRFTENTLRRRFRFPGRLQYGTLDEGLQRAIEEALQLPKFQPEPKRRAALRESDPEPPRPAAPRKPLHIDLSRALEVEQSSWDTTRKLLEAEGALEEAEESPALPPESPAPDIPETPEAPTASADAEEDPMLLLVRALNPCQRTVLEAGFTGDTAVLQAACTAAFTFPEAVWEEINELAEPLLGDLVLDSAGQPYEEYAEPLKSLLAATAPAR